MADDRYEGMMLKVENLDPMLVERNGRYSYYGWKVAVRGEKAGKWKILPEGHIGGEYNTRVLEAGGSGKYLVRTRFGQKMANETTREERVSLGKKDLFGGDE